MSDLHVVDPEYEIRRAFDAGDLQAAARLAFERYGREISSFLRARLRGEEHAQEAFAMFAEDLWSGVAKFGWRCTMRCWLYVLARNAASRYAKLPERRRHVPLSQHPSVLVQAATVRSPTAPHRDTSVKERMRALREQLDEQDRMLLILHVDRRLSWPEIALVLHEGAQPLEGPLHVREAARLRKRFERVKLELRRLAVADGLLRR
jgi:RNA polymerase sigma-70 factor, ECF subfamily